MSRTALAELAETYRTPFRRVPEPRKLDLPLGTYSTAQVAAMSGASFRQLQWWDEQGWLKVEHEGHHRVYDWTDAAMAIVVIELGKRGLTRWHRQKKVIHRLLIDAEQMTGQVWLATDGKEARLVTMLEDVHEFSKPVAAVYLTPILRMVKPGEDGAKR